MVCAGDMGLKKRSFVSYLVWGLGVIDSIIMAIGS